MEKAHRRLRFGCDHWKATTGNMTSLCGIAALPISIHRTTRKARLKPCPQSHE